MYFAFFPGLGFVCDDIFQLEILQWLLVDFVFICFSLAANL